MEVKVCDFCQDSNNRVITGPTATADACTECMTRLCEKGDIVGIDILDLFYPMP